MDDSRPAEGHPAPTGSSPPQVEANDVEALRGIEAALTSLANEYKTAAERHLFRAAMGLVIGFVTALLLPVAFTLIDAFVDRQLTGWRAESVADQDETVDNVANEFAQVRVQIDKYENEKREILRSAFGSHFGSVVFASSSVYLESAPRTSRIYTDRGYRCEGIEGSVTLYRSVFGKHYTGAVGLGEDSRRYQGSPALAVADSVDDGCRLLPLQIPALPTQSGMTPIVDVRNLSLVEDGSGLIAPVTLSKDGVDSDRFAGVVACLLNETAAANDPALCRFIAAPDSIQRIETGEIVYNGIGYGFGLVVNLRSESAVLLSLSVEEDRNAESDLDSLKLESPTPRLSGSFYQVIVKNETAFLIEDSYGTSARIVAVHAAQSDALSPHVEDKGSVGGADPSRILDVDLWNDKTFVLLSGQDQVPVLALAGLDRLIPLVAIQEPSAPERIDELHIVQRDDGQEVIVLQRSGRRRSGSPSSQPTAASSYSAEISRVAGLFEETDPLSEPPPELADKVFQRDQLWQGRDMLIPAADRMNAERARQIKPLLDAFTTAEISFQKIQNSLSTSREELAAAEQQVKDTESDIAFWSTIAARVVVIALIFYFVQLEMSLNRYNSRLSGHYRARALAMGYLLGTGKNKSSFDLENLVAAIVAIDSKEISSREPPGPPTDKLMELLQGILKSRVKPTAQ